MVARGSTEPRRTRHGSRPSPRALVCDRRPAICPPLLSLFLLCSCCRFIALPTPSSIFSFWFPWLHPVMTPPHDWYDRHDSAASVHYHSYSSRIPLTIKQHHRLTLAWLRRGRCNILALAATTSYIRIVLIVPHLGYPLLSYSYVLALSVAA